MSERVSVVLADDHPIFVDGIATAFDGRADLELVGRAAGGADALGLVRDLEPDVLVLDLDLPQIDGFAVLEALSAEELPTKVVVISAAESSAKVYRAIRLGARGYLSKAASAVDLCDAIATVGRGEAIVPAHLQDGLASEVRLRRAAPEVPTLSPRQLEIVRMTADGLSTAEIALCLHLSPATVKSHLQHVFENLGVSDRAAAVAKVMRAGLLD